MFQLSDIRVFLSVVEHQSFSVAAREMFISQAAASMRIKSLEEEAGIQLLLRNKSQVKLTEAGRAFLPYAQELLATEKNAKDILKNFSQGEKGTLTIAASAVVCSWVLPLLLKKMYTAYPKVEIMFQSVFSAEIINKVADGAVQFGIIRGNFPRLPDKRFFCKVLAKENIYFAAHHKHPIFRRPQIFLEYVAQTPLIVYSSSSGYWPHIKNIFDGKNLVPNVAFHVNDLNAAIILANLGLHICCLSEVALESSIRDGSLRIIAVEDYVPVPRYSTLIYRRDSKMTGAAKEFLEIVNSFETLEWPGVRAQCSQL